MPPTPALAETGTALWIDWVLVVTSIFGLAGGAHLVVEAASRIGKRLGFSDLVIGLTLVAMGTSAPEFGVTLTAAAGGQGDLSVGNVVGSNIFNLGFILGGCALVRAIPTTRVLVVRDGTLLLLVSVAMALMVGLDGHLGRMDGALLFGGLLIYLGALYRTGREALSTGAVDSGVLGDELAVAELDGPIEPSKSIPRDLLIFLAGLAVIILSSKLLVGSASTIARSFGVTEWVIGVTIVAAGTSAPELAISLVSLAKGRYDISAGNLIGSDLFNILGVLGLAGILRPVDVHDITPVSLWALPAMVACVVFFSRTGWRISRLEGVALLLFATSRWWHDLFVAGV